MRTRKALITGAGGFMGLHLVDFLQSKGFDILSTYYEPICDPRLLREKGEAVELDVRDKEKFKELIANFKPDVIYHLAAQSYPTVSWQRPNYTIDTNVGGTINLFESLKELKLNPVVLVACSSAEYGFVPENEVPIKESHSLLPLHPYGVSKVAQDLLTYQYYKNFGLKGIRARIFNTTGPGKVNDECSDFTKQVVMIEKGLSKVFRVGNLETRRAITDVRDAVNAFYLITERCSPGEVYNISGSKVYKVKEILDMILKITGIKAKIIVDQKLLRPTDEPIIYGDSSRLKTATGWEQKIPLEKTLSDMIDFWRESLNERPFVRFGKR